MRFAKIRKRIEKLLLLAVIFISGISVTARAEEMASIKVFYHGITHEERTIALPGAEFVLFRVGSLGNGEWMLQEQFADSDVPLNDMSASGQQQAAKNLYDYAKQKKLQGIEKKTDQDGYAVFQGLDEGLYLVSQKQDLVYGDGTFRSAPFLVSIPLKEDDGAPLYQITVEPKSEWAEKEEPVVKPELPEKPGETVSTPPEKTEPDNVQTGDQTPVCMATIFLIMSAVIVILIKKKDFISKD